MRKENIKWLIKIVLISIAASMVFTLVSTEIFGRAGYVIAFAGLIVFIIIAIVFDIIGVAVTVASEAPFHSMAAHHERGAVEALRLIKNADRVNSICIDIVGDVTGIVTGSMAALIAAQLMKGLNSENFLFRVLTSGIATGLMVGGKAAGKTLAINNNTRIVLRVGKLINVLRLK